MTNFTMRDLLNEQQQISFPLNRLEIKTFLNGRLKLNEVVTII